MAGLERATGAAGIDNGREKGDTCKEYPSWAVPDRALDASRNESDDRNATSSYNCSSGNPGPE